MAAGSGERRAAGVPLIHRIVCDVTRGFVTTRRRSLLCYSSGALSLLTVSLTRPAAATCCTTDVQRAGRPLHLHSFVFVSHSGLIRDICLKHEDYIERGRRVHVVKNNHRDKSLAGIYKETH